jgi:uncharacterized iron-regulated membrane protein
MGYQASTGALTFGRYRMRRRLFKLHSYLALLAFIPLLIVSVTGSILVFKTDIDQWLMPNAAALVYRTNPDVTFERQNHNALQKNIEQHFPDYIIGAWEIFNDGQEADRVYLVKKGSDDWYKIYFDPHANQVLSSPVTLTSNLTDWLLDLHYTFLLNGVGGEHAVWGTVLGLVAAIILTFLGVSGLIIHRKFWLKMLSLRRNKSVRVLFGDLHRLIGAWSSPVILILGVTGLYFNALSYYHEVFEHPSEEHYTPTARLYGQRVDFQHLLDDSLTQLDAFTPTYLLYPYEPEVDITVYGYQPGLNPFASDYSSTVTYDRTSGDLMIAVDGREANAVIKVTDSFRELHFGSFGGLTSKIIWCALGLAPLFLALTGVYIWLHRRRKKQKASGRYVLQSPS